MLELGGERIFLGGFHDHWARADQKNASALMALVSYCHYDFIALMDDIESSKEIRESVRAFSDKINVLAGKEYMFGWGHVVTIGLEGPMPQTDEKDVFKAFADLKRRSKLAVLAHPGYPSSYEQLFKSGLLDKLIDEKAIDGIQLESEADEASNSPKATSLIAWYRERAAKGDVIANCSGWDIHNPPDVQKPLEPFIKEVASWNRSIVFAEDNSEDAICEAVKAGRVVMERGMGRGDLLGPRRWTDFLKKHGYFKAIAKLDKRRDALKLSLGGDWLAGEEAEVAVNETGSLSVAESMFKAKKLNVEKDVKLNLGKIPCAFDRNVFLLPLAFRAKDGFERIWAIPAKHQIQLDLIPRIDKDKTAVELARKAPFAGVVRFEGEGLEPVEMKLGEKDALIPLPVKPSNEPLRYKAFERNLKGAERVDEGFLTFINVPGFAGSWDKIASIDVDEKRFAPEVGSVFGANRPWPGPKEFSAKTKIAWTSDALLFRSEVTDPVHFQPNRGHFIYNGDCAQIGIDPVLERSEIAAGYYDYSMALTNDGPELFRYHAPENAGLKSNISLGAKWLKAERKKDGRTIYELTLPWSELAPAKAEKGARIGIYLIFFNNNGAGHLDTLHWPIPLSGMWMTPKRWATLTLA